MHKAKTLEIVKKDEEKKKTGINTKSAEIHLPWV